MDGLRSSGTKWQLSSTHLQKKQQTPAGSVGFLLDPCTDQMRALLQHHVPPQTFPQVIQRHRLKLPKLTKPQMDLILPRSGHYTGNYSDFDISLLYTLLRNICNIRPHTKGWGKDPDPNDVSLSANIERIHITRNKAYGHVLSSSLSNSDFNGVWSTIRAAVVGIDAALNNNQQYEKAVDLLKFEVMDPQMAKQYETRLRDQMKEDTETRKIIDDHKAKFEEFKTDSTTRQDRTETDIQRHDAEIRHIKQKTDEHTSRQNKIETDIQRHNTEILHIKQQTDEHTFRQERTETDIQTHDAEILHIKQQADEHTSRQDRTETDIQRHNTEILYIRKQIDDEKSVTASIQEQQTQLEQMAITNRTRQDNMKADIHRHDKEIVNLRQQIEIKQSVTGRAPPLVQQPISRKFVLVIEESMATSAYASTIETTNANRASRILLGPCTDQLRDVLRRHIPPATFHYVITRNRSNLPRLTPPQRDLILPRPGRYSGDYSDMDISLLYLLLRNICNISPHTKGWGNTPDISDTSLSASIDRIREARNAVVHSSSTALNDTDFDDLLDEIKKAVRAMDSYLVNSNGYEKEIDFLLIETMDPEQDVCIRLLKKQLDEDKTTMDRVTKLEKRVHALEDISTVQREVRRLDTRVEGLDTRVEGLDTRVEGLDTRVEGLDTRVEGLDTKMEGLDTRMEGLDTRVEGLDTRMEGLDTRVEGLDTRVEELDTRVEGLDTRAEGLDTRVEELDTRVEGLDTRVEELDTRVEGLDTRVEVLDTRVEGLDTRVEMQMF